MAVQLKKANFTGPRPEKLGGYDENGPLWKEAEAKAYAMVEASHFHFGTTIYTTGLANGFDRIAAKAVLALADEGLPLKLVAAMPFDTQWCKWPRSSFEDWLNVLMRAHHIYHYGIHVSDRKELFEDLIDLADRKYRLREDISECMISEAVKLLDERNKFMVDKNDLVLGCWDGTPGGTANCLKDAAKAGRPTMYWHLTEKRYVKHRMEPMVLECSTKGDKRGSALCAIVEAFGKSDTIENHYQLSKVFWRPHSRTLEMREVRPNSMYEAKDWQKEGSYPRWFSIGGHKYDAKLLSAWYDMLWIKYLNNNPEFVEYLRVFDDYHDVFKTKKTMNCQADTIREYITKGPKVMMHREDIYELARLIEQNKREDGHSA